MAEFPALPVWTDAYLADTRHLSTVEHGAYLLLLFEAWRRPTCSLPDNDAMLARLAGLSVDEWAQVRDNVMAFWKLDGRSRTWTQKRLLEQREFTRKKSTSQRDKAAKRWNKTKKIDAPAMPERCPGDASISIGSVPNGTGADAPLDPVKELFDAGVALLTAKGRKEPAARGIIGKWRKAHGEAQALAAIVACRDSPEDISEPVSWIEARFKAIAEPEDEADAIHRATAERYRRMDMPGPPPRAGAEN